MVRKLMVYVISLSLVRCLIKIFLFCFQSVEAFISLCSISLKFPSNTTVRSHYSTIITYSDRISLGKHVWIGRNCILGGIGGIKIGDFVRISPGVVIQTRGLEIHQSNEIPYPSKAKPICIGNGVWIASRAVILGGVTVGDYAVIGAGAIITKDVESHSIVVGSPTRCIGKVKRKTLQYELYDI
uniref:acyltransferase n=1 Tax=Petrachloros mirabilis TaxID=2918835 RepID=UPI00137AEADA|nr:acyltransferase [Petrachloros mirabilis]